MCEQQPVIQQDINKWNKNDFTVMERRLSRFIPLIRFYHISTSYFSRHFSDATQHFNILNNNTNI